MTRWNKYPDKAPNIGDVCLIINMDDEEPETSIETCVYKMVKITAHNDVGYVEQACFETRSVCYKNRLVYTTPTHWQLLDLPAKEPEHD
jgi:hypothetical protein